MVTGSLSGFYRLSVTERLRRLSGLGIIDETDLADLAAGGYVLGVEAAERMIENVIGVFGLPLGLIPNARIDGRDFIVPMAVEEPSIVAAASAAFGLAAKAGGIQTSMPESLLIGQVQLLDIGDVDAALERLAGRESDIVDAANAVQPNMVARGGGARSIDIRRAADEHALVVHLLVDTCDAMGANLVNTQCEAIAPLLADIAGGRAGLKILSNLADRSLVSATVRIPAKLLARHELAGDEVRDRIAAASRFAATDRYRAVTHNKGILNGIDPIAVATGNDWRALAASCHAWAARDGRYRGLATWRAASGGELVGEMTLPLKPGIVGASIRQNPGAGLALALLGVKSAGELARVMAATGLAQNFAALRALALEGIQAGHMRLHARGVVRAAGIPASDEEAVVRRLVASGEIKEWKALEIHRSLSRASASSTADVSAHGKLILAGEHAVVHGARAVAVPIPDALLARVSKRAGGVNIRVAAWGVDVELDAAEPDDGVAVIARAVMAHLGIDADGLSIDIAARYPAGAGLGASASLAVLLARAFDRHYSLGLADSAIDAAAFAAETAVHGNPSGIDNTVATYGRPVLFRRGEPPERNAITLAGAADVVIALAEPAPPTAEMVRRVAGMYEAEPDSVGGLIESIDALVGRLAERLENGDIDGCGAIMNLNHGILNSLGLSTPGLERLVHAARAAGAAGAKLTGGGGGGAMVALARAGSGERIRKALQAGGAKTYAFELGADNDDA